MLGAEGGLIIIGERLVLRTAIGQYPHTSALMEARILSNLVTLDFGDTDD